MVAENRNQMPYDETTETNDIFRIKLAHAFEHFKEIFFTNFYSTVCEMYIVLQCGLVFAHFHRRKRTFR